MGYIITTLKQQKNINIDTIKCAFSYSKFHLFF